MSGKNKKKAGGSSKSSKSAASAAGSAAAAPAESIASCTGVRHRAAFRNIEIGNVSMTFHGVRLLDNGLIKLTSGHRYGLIGSNGSGKTTFLRCIANREFPVPDDIDVYLVSGSVPASDDTAMETVMKADTQKAKLEEEAALLSDQLGNEDVDEDALNHRLSDIYERLEELESATAEARAAQILFGLGFSAEAQNKKTREFSGGWRMRIALARALYLKPSLLLMDGPTAHLDLEACVWLEDYLQRWNPQGIILMVSHSQDFLNSVCTDIIHIHKNTLNYYSGNYDQYVTTRAENEENQMKKFEKEQAQIADLKDYIARFGHGTAKLARQAKSREKLLAHFTRDGLTEEVIADAQFSFSFPDPGSLPTPVLVFNDVAFNYPSSRTLYRKVNVGVDLDSRIAILGPNGAGKSTLIKLMMNEIQPTEGSLGKNSHLRFGRFYQHSADQLDLAKSPLQFMMDTFPGNTDQSMRGFLGRFGVSGPTQTALMGTLSDGQKSRVVFAIMAYRTPHLLLLDEPTNALDMDSIDALADALNEFKGGVVLVSHDMRLISQVANEIWIVDNECVTRYPGDMNDYKKDLTARVLKAAKAFAASK